MHMFDVSYLSALVGGLLTFLAPCTLPLIPAYIAFISGSNSIDADKHFSRRNLMRNALFFIAGFSSIFILFGLASGVAGKFLVLHRMLLAQVGGVFIVFFGLSMLGVLPALPSLSRGRIPDFISAGSPFGGFALGLLFALGWSPCLGPILGTILILAGTTGTALSGASLLAVYSFGLAFPFFLVAFLYGSTFTYVAKLQTYLPLISKIGAFMIIFIGILLIIGQFGVLNSWAQYTFDIFGIGMLPDLM